MAVKLGINGFGRIGRTALRQALDMPEKFEVRGINYRDVDLEYMAYMVRYDSTFGRYHKHVEIYDGGLIVDGVKVPVFDTPDADKIPWGDAGVEYVVESTGKNLTTESALVHLSDGAKKVVLTAPAKDATPMFVMGVNTDEYTPDMKVVSNASCTTNCLAPIAKVVNDNFGIRRGLMTTVHASTSKQKTVDSRSMNDWRAGRSVYNNIIPTSTGAAKAVGRVIPELNGRLTGISMRVPAVDVSMVDLVVELEKHTSYKEVCNAIKDASANKMKGIIGYYDEPVVSTDFIGAEETSNFDVGAGLMLDDDFIKLVAWYDNEWGYSNKVLGLVEHMAHVDAQ